MTVAKKIIKSYFILSAPAIAPGEITLREWGDGWVTHFHNLQDGGYYHGHYFTDLAQAEADFEERVRKELRLPADAELPQPSLAPVKIPVRVAEGLLAVAEVDRLAQFSVEFVKLQAVALGYVETAHWIDANYLLYLDGVCRGFEVEIEL